MALILKKVRWQNLLSTGNIFTEVDLTKKKTTLIVGQNGSGKSTILEALCFCLYKKAFRNINLPQLVNSIRKKDLLVEVELSMNGKEYLVRRGIKPALFEIYQDGILLNQHAETKDYQDFLETNILKMNFRSFKQIVILGSADFVPFMQLPAQGRREVIEDLLDLQVFSTMNTLLKSRIEENRVSISEVEKEIILTTNLLDMHEKHANELKKSKEEVIEIKQTKINELLESNKLKTIEIQGMQSMIETLKSEAEKLEKYADRLNNTTAIISKLKTKLKENQLEVKFYSEEHLQTCPTCKQAITDAFKAEMLGSKKKAKDDIREALDIAETKREKLTEKVTQLRITQENIQKFTNAIVGATANVTATAKLIETLQEEIQALQVAANKPIEDIDGGTELRVKMAELRRKKQELSSEREMLSVAGTLLKDGGIKSLIIKQHIPLINKYINKYLQMMKFHVDFHFDENFKETIRSRYRDEFSYESFSQGEKTRINLALILAWRAITKMRNSSSTNLLIFDEIFDSSLDEDGVEFVIKTLETLTNENIFVISHTIDQKYFDCFERTLSVKKVKNFSQMKEANLTKT